MQLISYALVTSLLVGIARAWELVGDRDTGISASIAVLAGHPPSSDDVLAPDATGTREAGDILEDERDAHEIGEGGE